MGLVAWSPLSLALHPPRWWFGSAVTIHQMFWGEMRITRPPTVIAKLRFGRFACFVI